MVQADPALFDGDHGGEQPLGIFPQRKAESGLVVSEGIERRDTLIATLMSFVIFTLI